MLAYGSNRCPSKITWLRERARPAAPTRWWCCGRRAPHRAVGARVVGATGLRVTRDGAADPARAGAHRARGRSHEDHAVWLATPEQIEVLDRCEGRDDRFRLARLHTGEVRTEDGARIDAPWVYLGHAAIRRPLLVDGRPVRCAEVPQAVAGALDGEPGSGDGLDAATVTGAPHPDEWPAALFAYGLLQPGQPSWHRVAPHAAGTPRPARLPGTVLDTGSGYPAWLPEGGVTTPGTLVPLRDPARPAARPGRLRRPRVPADPRRAARRRHGVLGLRVDLPDRRLHPASRRGWPPTTRTCASSLVRPTVERQTTRGGRGHT